MLIRWEIKNGKNIPQDLLSAEVGFDSNDDYSHMLHKKFVVYGMTLYLDYIWFYICEDKNASNPFPIWHPAPIFSINDARLSKYWIYSVQDCKELNRNRHFWTFPDWAIDPFFYSRLLDNEVNEVEVFKKYKLLMDLEFPDPDISEKATALEDGWVMCPTCIDAWQPHSYSGMIVCPKCHHTMHNPYYIDFHSAGVI